MRVLLQRVKKAKVQINGNVVGKIDQGILLFVGFSKSFKEVSIKKCINKISTLRIFENNEQKLDKSILDIQGEILIVSQFTLLANLNKGRRPDFTNSLHPELANKFYVEFVTQFKKLGLKIETGVFGANMQVSLTNDGPVTLILDF